LAIHLLPDLRPAKAWQAHDCHIYQASFSPDGKFILSADLKGRLKVWDGSGQLVREFTLAALHKYDAGFGADIGGVRAWSFSPDGASIACSGITNVSNAFAGVGNPLILVANWTTGEVRAELRSKEAFQGTGWGVAWHKSGFILGSAGGNGGMLWAWRDDFKPPASPAKKEEKKEPAKDAKKPEEKKLEPINEFVAHKLPDNVRDMALSADGKRLAIAYQGGVARVYALA
jgi:WD40 repeat protein